MKEGKEGNLTDARKYLRNHESQRDKKILQKPTKVTLQELLDNWNSKFPLNCLITLLKMPEAS